MTEETSGRNEQLDLMRLIACVAVVGLHTLRLDGSISNAFLYNLCGFAVPIFYMSSGYVLLHKKTVSVCYARRKVLSILRVIVIWNVMYWFAKTAAKWVFFHEQPNRPFGTLLDETVSSLFQKGSLWQFWYLGALIILYLCLPVMHKWIYGQNKVWKSLWLLFLSVSLTAQGVSMVVGSPIQKNVVQTLRIWTWIHYFILGGGIDYLGSFITKVFPTKKRHACGLISCSVVVAIWQVFAGRCIIHNTYAEYFYDDGLTVLWTIILFSYVLRLDISNSFVGKMSARLTPCIMGVFIIHPLLINVVRHYFTISDTGCSVAFFIGILIGSFMIVDIISRTRLKKYLIKL